MKTVDIVIIGGGPIAVSFISQLNKRVGSKKLSVIIFEQSSNYAAGYAYKNRNDHLILNTPVDTMSVLPDEATRFSKWLSSKGIHNVSSFVPRHLFGDYLMSELDFVLKEVNNLSIEVINDVVVNCI